MDPAPAQDDLDAALLVAWAAMKDLRWDDALRALPGDDTPERPGAMARVYAFRAQALFELARWADAERAAATAVRWARKEPGQPGAASVRALHARILASHAAQAAAAVERRADEALADSTEPLDPADATGAARLIRKANILLDRGDPPAARAAAIEVWNCTDAPLRERVLAALTLARCGADPGHWVTVAHEAADRADDQNLLTAVARAARATGVALKLLP